MILRIRIAQLVTMSAEVFVVFLGDGLTDIRILEHKALVELVLQPVHFAPDNIQQRLVIDQDFDAILFDLFIQRRRLIHIFQMVCQPGASLRVRAYPYELRFLLFEKLSQM